MVDKQLLSVPEVGHVLGVSARTVYRLVASGQLVIRKVRGCSRIGWCDVKAYLERLSGRGRA